MEELVSVITPAFRAEKFIGRTVLSVIGQTYPNWEMLIVADDDEDYESLLRNKGICDARLRFLRSGQHQSGPNRARNVALDAAAGAWIAPLDADDFFYPDRLKLLLEQAQETGLALDNGYMVADCNDSQVEKIFNDLPEGKFTFAQFSRVHVPLLFLIHRCLISLPWDPDIDRGADTIFNLRALEAAGWARYHPAPLHEYNVHCQSICHSEGAASQFDNAYHYTLGRLMNDGLGFRSSRFRARVQEFIERKRRLNHRFDEAIAEGYCGNFQTFLSDHGFR